MSDHSIQVGDKIKDNDPRMSSRPALTIVALGLVTDRGLQNVRVQNGAGRKFYVSVSRIYSDGKPRRSGFDLLADGGAK